MIMVIEILVIVFYIAFRERQIYKKTGNRINFYDFRDKELKKYKGDIVVIGILLMVIFLELFFAFFQLGFTIFKSKWYFISLSFFLYFIFSFIFREKLINSIGLKKYGEHVLYFRDLPSRLSPAEVSYLFHHKIYGKKELTATILMLYTKGYLLLEFTPEICYKVQQSSNYLSADEMYVLDWLKTNEKNFHQYEWKKIVRNSMKNNVMYKRVAFSTFLSFVVPIFLFFVSVILLTNPFHGILYYLLLGVMILSAYEFFFQFLILILSQFFKRMVSLKVYTKEGYLTLDKWISFRRFLRDFTILDQSDVKQIVLYQQYLAYAIVFDIPIKKEYIIDENIRKFLDFKVDFWLDDVVDELLDSMADIVDQMNRYK